MPPSRTLELVWALPDSEADVTQQQVGSPIDHSEDAECGSNSTQAKHAKKRSPSHIPRPPNAFILFRSSFIKSQHVSTDVETNHSTLSKIIGMAWHGLPDSERQIWHDKARAALDEHRKRFPAYAFRPAHLKAAPGGRAGGGPRKRKVREVEPKDVKRCEKIAELLVKGLKGTDLDDAIREFDKTHVPEIITRFDTPITESAYRTVKNKRSHSASVRREPVDNRSSSPRPPALEESFVEQQMYYPEPVSPGSAYSEPNPYPSAGDSALPSLSTGPFSYEYAQEPASPYSPLNSATEPVYPTMASFSRRSFSSFPSDLSLVYQPNAPCELDFFSFTAPSGNADYLADLMNFEMPMPLVPTWDVSAPLTVGF